MTPLVHPYSITSCKICGSLVRAANLPEHLLADASLLRIIKGVHPGWNRQECEDYLVAISGTGDRRDCSMQRSAPPAPGSVDPLRSED